MKIELTKKQDQRLKSLLTDLLDSIDGYDEEGTRYLTFSANFSPDFYKDIKAILKKL